MKNQKERVKLPEIYPGRERLDKLLAALLGDEDLVDKWWNSPNLAFKAQTPEELIQVHPQIVVNYILKQFHY